MFRLHPLKAIDVTIRLAAVQRWIRTAQPGVIGEVDGRQTVIKRGSRNSGDAELRTDIRQIGKLVLTQRAIAKNKAGTCAGRSWSSSGSGRSLHFVLA